MGCQKVVEGDLRMVGKLTGVERRDDAIVAAPEVGALVLCPFGRVSDLPVGVVDVHVG